MGEIARQDSTISRSTLKRGEPLTPFAADSLKKRYTYKLISNFLGLGIGFISQAIIPRGLGPKAYGDFNFLTNFFTQVVGFFDMGTSTAFYTKLSQRPEESSLVTFYSYFAGTISLLTILLVFLSTVSPAHVKLWPSQKMLYIYLAAGWGIFNWIVTVLTMMADAYGATVSSELSRVFQKFLGLVLIILLYAFNVLNITALFYYHYFLFFVLIVLVIWITQQYHPIRYWRLRVEQIKGYLHEFYHYSHPLFTYSLVSLIVGLVDIWLLQFYSGSIQQGFYGISYQISGICFVFTGAMTPLFIRELSVAFGIRDVNMMTDLFRRYIPMLYSIGAFFSCFIAVQADKVVYFFSGDKFGGAVTAVTIMAFYPLQQTYGQLSGSVFLATGQTLLYRNIGLVMMIIGLPLTYLMIAPPELGGMGLGANGLALKTVLLNIAWVNVQLYFNSRYLNFSFWKYVGHQILCVACLLVIAIISTKIFIIQPLRFSNNILINFLSSGFLYTILVFSLAYKIPLVFGLKKRDIQSTIRFLRDRLAV